MTSTASPENHHRIEVTAVAAIQSKERVFGYVKLTQETGGATQLNGRLTGLPPGQEYLSSEICVFGSLGAESLLSDGEISFDSVGQPYNPRGEAWGE